MQDDTHLHIQACQMADDRAFLLYGTDSIAEYDVLWPRWLELYQNAMKKLYGDK